MRRAALALLCLCAGGWDVLRAPDPDVNQGNQAFAEGRYDEALESYRAAESRGVDPRLHFDMGAALYKLGEKSADEGEKAKLFAQAEEQFRRAADTDDVQLKSSAYFNLGNTMYQRQQWEDAIAAYKRSLRADVLNEAARNNLEMALRQRQKQDQQQQQGQQGQPDKKDQQQGQGQQKGQQGQQGKQDQDQQQQQDQDQQQQGQPGQQDQKDQKQQQGGQAEQDVPDSQAGSDRQPQDQQDKKGQQERERQQRQQEEREQAEQGSAESESPSDQDRKLDELERRSRDLRKRLLRQGGRNRDPLRLPSRRDW